VKRLIIAMFLMICFLGIIKVHADDYTVSETKDTLIQLNILNEKGFLNPDAITRGECLIAIMRVIGVTDEEVALLNGSDVISFVDTNTFSYFGCADWSRIAYGEEFEVDNSSFHRGGGGPPPGKNRIVYYFFPNREVTLNECLAFMVRCLEQSVVNAETPDDANKNLDVTFEKAKEYGLINDEDEFVLNSDSTVNQDDFCVLLGRLLEQKRYKYYERKTYIFNGKERSEFRWDGYVDENRSMTYHEMLNQRQEDEQSADETENTADTTGETE